MKPLVLLVLSIASAIAVAQDVHVTPRVKPKTPAPTLASSAPAMIMPNIEFRGFWPGMTRPQAKERYLQRQADSDRALEAELAKRGLSRAYLPQRKDWNCTPADSTTTSCNSYVTGGEEMNLEFLDDRLVDAGWHGRHESYESIKQGLIEKFGEPTIKKVATYQNRMGGKFEGENLIWKNAGKVLLLDEYGWDLDNYSVQIIDEVGFAQFKKQTAGKPDI